MIEYFPFPIREIQTDNGTEWTNALLVKTATHKTLFENYLEEKEYSTFETANRYDLGFRIGCGYDFNKHIEFAVNYTLGMNCFSNTANYRWRGWNLHLVVFF